MNESKIDYDKRRSRYKLEEAGSWKLVRTAPNGDITEFDIEDMGLKTLAQDIYFGQIHRAVRRPRIGKK